MLGLRAEWHGAISEQQTFAFGLVGQMIVHSLWACRAPYRIHEDLVPHRADAQPVRYHALGDLPLLIRADTPLQYDRSTLHADREVVNVDCVVRREMRANEVAQLRVAQVVE